MDLLWMDFLNSIWHDWRGTGRPTEDRLKNNEWLENFLKKWDLVAEVPPSVIELETLNELRDFLQQLTELLAKGGELQEGHADRLNQYLEKKFLIRRFTKKNEAWKWELLPTDEGWGQVEEAIVTSFIQTVIDGGQDRIKICDNKDCLWVFYDRTKNHSKKYCDDKACGNLLKVRHFRERQRNKK